MSADIVLQPTTVRPLDLIGQALELADATGDIWEQSITLGLQSTGHMDAQRITLGVLTTALDRRYGSGAVERYADDLGRAVSPSSLYAWSAWVECLTPATALNLLAEGVCYTAQRTALSVFKRDREAILAHFEGRLALPVQTTDKTTAPRKIVEAQKATMLGVMRPGVVMLDLGGLAIDLEVGKKYHVVFYETEEL